MKTKIAYIIPTLSLGGAEKQQVNILNCINTDKYEVTLFVLRSNVKLFSLIKQKNVKVKIYDINSIKDIKKFLQFILDIKKFDPHIIHSHMYNANILARMLKIIIPNTKIINHYHGLSNWLNKWKLFIEKATIFLVDKFIVVSEESYKVRLKRERFPKEKMILLINSVDFVNDERECETITNSQRNKIVIGMASRLIKLKNIEGALFLIKYLIDSNINVELKIAGEGEHKSNLIKYAEELDIQDKVKFLGYVKNMKDFYKQIDIYCISSYTEDMPLSILEASMSGKPIISSNLEGIKRLFKKEKECIIFVDDFFEISELKKVINFIQSINSYNCCKKLIKFSKENFSNIKYCELIENLYKEMINEKNCN